MEDHDLLLRAGVRSLLTNVESNLGQAQTPKSFAVSQNYPNPFNGSTTFHLDVFKPDHYSVLIANITGRIVKTIFSDEYLASSQNVLWDGNDNSGKNMPSGIYLARVTSRQHSQQIQLLLIR